MRVIGLAVALIISLFQAPRPVEAQQADPSSPLSVVRAALAARHHVRDAPAPEWLVEDDDLVAFRRGDVSCVLTTGDRSVPLADFGDDVLVSSRPVRGGELPGPGTAWLR